MAFFIPQQVQNPVSCHASHRCFTFVHSVAGTKDLSFYISGLLLCDMSYDYSFQFYNQLLLDRTPLCSNYGSYCVSSSVGVRNSVLSYTFLRKMCLVSST